MFPFGETVEVLSPSSTTDAYNNTVEDWTTPTETPVEDVGVEPRPSTEDNRDARNAVTSGFTLYMPAGSVVTAKNRVRVRGDDYAVDGEPAEWRNPFTGWEPGLVVQTKRMEG
jgi:hypothetical protein